jgi:hypothetical protein
MSESKDVPREKFGENRKYFDKYYLKVDDSFKTAENQIRYNFEKLKEQSLQVPSPNELKPLIPKSLSNSDDDKKRSNGAEESFEWDQLQIIYEAEFKRRDVAWPKRYEYLKMSWDEVQEIFIRQIKFRKDYPSNEKKFVANQKVGDFKQIIDNPRCLENLSMQELYKEKEIVESEIALEIDRLDVYKRDVKEFLKDWENYRIARIKFDLLKKYRVSKLGEDLESQLIDLADQYKQAKLYAMQFKNQDEKNIEVICKQGSFLSQRDVVINPNEKVHTFIEKVISQLGKQINNNNAQAFIQGGPRMNDDCFLGDYNFSLINSIQIVFF